MDPNHDDRPVLDYRPPQPAGPNVAVQCILAAFLTAVAIVVGVFVWIFGAFAMTYGKGRSASTAVEILSIAAAVVAIAGVNVLAYRNYRHPARRGFGLGMWIGLGIALLIERACFTGRLN